jgi:dolichol-phosphate mannosyltransferase
MRILTAIPVYNEESYIEPIVGEILRHADHVLVIDDGSTDGTSRKLAGFGDQITVLRHHQNKGYGAALQSALHATTTGGFDGLVTLDCDGQHEPCRIPQLITRLAEADIVSGSRYLEVFDPAQTPPEDRRKINRQVTQWLNQCLNLNLTDAFCGFKAYRASALQHFDITENGYAMPLELWVQAANANLKIVEEPVPLIYLDLSRAFGGALDDSEFRLRHYREIFQRAIARAGLPVPEGCA